MQIMRFFGDQFRHFNFLPPFQLIFYCQNYIRSPEQLQKIRLWMFLLGTRNKSRRPTNTLRQTNVANLLGNPTLKWRYYWEAQKILDVPAMCDHRRVSESVKLSHDELSENRRPKIPKIPILINFFLCQRVKMLISPA